MPASDLPCFSLAIARLTAADPQHYAAWVLQAPYPGGYVHHDQLWTAPLQAAWQGWQGFFSLRSLSAVPPAQLSLPPVETPQNNSYTSRLMQHLGTTLWQWLFDGEIQTSFNQSQGIAMGQGRPLRLRLDIRDPQLIALPWEIMQPQAGKQAISLSQQLLFSRTTSDVDPLPLQRSEQVLKVLLVLGQASEETVQSLDPQAASLNLDQEATALRKILESVAEGEPRRGWTAPVTCQVTTLIQPTPAELIASLESTDFNVMFYAGHGVPAPDGGLLFLRPDATLNGTELAQVLIRRQIKLTVFNTCWGAQPDQQDNTVIPRSSLAEVLIHHGVPAVLAMRDSIADEEALCFIQEFTRALAERAPIDEAVAIARQQLLTLYKFNQPAWTLPVLYMHPEFDGELIRPLTQGVTELPEYSVTWFGKQSPMAFVRSLTTPSQLWSIRGGMMRIGSREGNDLVLQYPGISREHAEIVYRESSGDTEAAFYLRDRSRYGTWISQSDGWQKVHNQEVAIASNTQIKFGNPRTQALEFVVDG